MYWNGGKGVELEPSLQKRSNMIWRAFGGVNRNITYYGVRRAKLLWYDDWENVGRKSHLSGKQHYRNGHFISNKSSTRGFIKIWFFFSFLIAYWYQTFISSKWELYWSHGVSLRANITWLLPRMFNVWIWSILAIRAIIKALSIECRKIKKQSNPRGKSEQRLALLLTNQESK